MRSQISAHLRALGSQNSKYAGEDEVSNMSMGILDLTMRPETRDRERDRDSDQRPETETGTESRGGRESRLRDGRGSRGGRGGKDGREDTSQRGNPASMLRMTSLALADIGE